MGSAAHRAIGQREATRASQAPPLPTFRPTARRVLVLLREVDKRWDEIRDLILTDPGLCCALLGEANRDLEGLGIVVSDVDVALQVLGEQVVRSTVGECLRSREVTPEGRDLERLRHAIMRGLVSGALASLLESVSPDEARVAGLLRWAGPADDEASRQHREGWEQALEGQLPRRMTRAILCAPPARARPRRSDDELRSLLDLADHMTHELGGGFAELPAPAGEGAERLAHLTEMAHDHVARELSDALTVLGICLGVPQLGPGNFVEEYRRLLTLTADTCLLPEGLPAVLRETLHGVRASETEAEALKRLVAGIRSVSGVRRVLVALNEAGNAVAASGGSQAPFFVRDRDLAAIVPGLSEFLEDLQSGGRSQVLAPGRPCESLLTAFKAAQALVLPLRAARRSLGVLMVATDHPDPESLATALEVVVQGAGEAVEKAQMLRTSYLLTERMTMDSLTQVLQRGHLLDLLEGEIRASNRYRRPIALAMIDVDHFKAWNDSYGHQVGDRLLRDVAQVIRDCSRDSDRVGRYGGDEFIVILPGATLEDAHGYAERVRARVEALGRIMQEACYEHSLTLSIGVAASSHYPVETGALMFRADHALYRAKEGGRNRVDADHG